MSVSAISRRYAKAMVRLASEQNQIERFGEELGQFNALLAREDRLRLILESPSFPMDRKTAILEDLLASLQPTATVKNFLGLLLEKDRLQYLALITGDYRALADELSGIVRARVTAAASLSAEQRQAIGKSLQQQTGKQVELTVAVDSSLLGGLQAEIGGRLFDGSLRTQLNRIEDTLKKG
ncbi:ATP synthase F1 subunit delta [Desulfuromonas carbonis]|uniref:ATP synthase F1 subunit delta n=1 Tax=Desulfuromonas sp. DDH964 TaxID=1823759 RepID=UPI00078D776F|nr:ATP synthase F1 subunit delta [Desulfuromonas sp. DDH964]AMV73964.1 F0F1 ATP synthase subunit delta [Desulfuromonas sp. DDH964]